MFSTSHPCLLVRFEATAALGKLAQMTPTQEVLNWLMDCLADRKQRVRYGAVQSFRRVLEVEKQIELPSCLNKWQDDDFGVMYELSLIKKLMSEQQSHLHHTCGQIRYHA